MATKLIEVEVDIDTELDDFSDDDLISELRCRGFMVYGGGDINLALMYELIAQGNEMEAMQKFRAFIQDKIGRVLP